MTQTANPATSTGLAVWVDGTLHTDPTQAKVSALDHGFIVGDGVFETVRAEPFGPFALTRHLQRLTNSARGLGLPDPDHDRIREGIDAVLRDRTWPLGRIRITWTGGFGPLGSAEPFGPPTLVIAADAMPAMKPATRAVTAPWVRNERGAMTGVKTTSYAENVRALAYAHQHDATETIFANTLGNLCEGTGTNVFCVFGDRVVTPPLSAGPLAGVTRALVLEWCGGEEADLPMEQAQQADEVFLASTGRDVQAIVSWDDRRWEEPGPVTRRFAEIFAERMAADHDPV